MMHNHVTERRLIPLILCSHSIFRICFVSEVKRIREEHLALFHLVSVLNVCMCVVDARGNVLLCMWMCVGVCAKRNG